MLSEHAVGRLLDDLCTKLGFCLPPADRFKLQRDPPRDVRAFTDAVFLAEGLDVERAGLQLYRQVRDLVAAAFERDCDGDA